MRYTLVRKLSIIGREGPLSVWMRRQTGESPSFNWELTGAALVKVFAPEADPVSHTVVMDMMPEKLAGASLCHVVSIAGQSQYDESDIVIVMRELSMLEGQPFTSDIRSDFLCDEMAKTSDIIESMGVSGGTRSGSYKWCAPKMNIGATVFRARPAAVHA